MHQSERPAVAGSQREMCMKKWKSAAILNLLERPFGQLSESSIDVFSCLLLFPAAFVIFSLHSCVAGLPAAGPTDFKLRMCSSVSGSGDRYADIFVFNDDGLARLDSYQRFLYDEGAAVDAASTSGGRIVVAVVTPDADKISWAAMNSYSALCCRETDLRGEDPSFPVLSGETRVSGSAKEECEMILRPLLSKVVLRSISCDFSGRSYSGASLRNARVYLTNVSSRCRLLDDSSFTTTEVLNAGGLCDTDLKSLRCPEMLSASLPSEIGWDVVRTDVGLCCYPNTNETESAGTPFTRLVIEGEVDGRTWYWPINVNRGEFSPVCGPAGITRDCSYVFDVSIFRLGSEDPDTPVSPASVSLECSVVPWITPPEIEEPF